MVSKMVCDVLENQKLREHHGSDPAREKKAKEVEIGGRYGVILHTLFYCLWDAAWEGFAAILESVVILEPDGRI